MEFSRGTLISGQSIIECTFFYTFYTKILKTSHTRTIATSLGVCEGMFLCKLSDLYLGLSDWRYDRTIISFFDLFLVGYVEERPW